ncbi:hypothetical protein HOA93_03490 [bacterium]|nr:hypothetical protein [bacterium]
MIYPDISFTSVVFHEPLFHTIAVTFSQASFKLKSLNTGLFFIYQYVKF